MTKMYVQQWQKPNAKVAIDPDATVGATIGVNLFNQDGTLWVPPAASGAGDMPVSPISPTTVDPALWSDVQGLKRQIMGIGAHEVMDVCGDGGEGFPIPGPQGAAGARGVDGAAVYMLLADRGGEEAWPQC